MTITEARHRLAAAREMFASRPDAFGAGMCEYYQRLLAKLEKKHGTNE